jgi:hypothetical protein
MHTYPIASLNGGVTPVTLLQRSAKGEIDPVEIQTPQPKSGARSGERSNHRIFLVIVKQKLRKSG